VLKRDLRPWAAEQLGITQRRERDKDG
jgi:hypothetical protein